jgi:replicative DNA helicase
MDMASLGVIARMFFYPWHASIWLSVEALSAMQLPYGPVEVAADMESAGSIENLHYVGGAGYLTAVAVSATACGNLDYWARHVKRCPRCGR